jgi:drug/metabolite transporter (DMT)-like permease
VSRETLLPRSAALAAITLWGISFVATKAALAEASPITVVFTRFALGAALLVALGLARREPVMPARAHWGGVALLAFVGVFVHQMLQVHGLALTTAIRTGWLIGLIPIWSAILASILLHERFGAQKIAGIALGAIGALLVVTRGELSSRVLALPSTRGDLLVLASTLNWAIYTVLGAATLARIGIGSGRATAAVMVFGCAMLVPLFVVARGWRDYAHLSPSGAGAIVFLGIGCSGLGYLLWSYALERLEASRVAAFLYLEPLVTLAAAVLLLHETVTLTTVVGGLIVLLGVAIVQRAPRK